MRLSRSVLSLLTVLVIFVLLGAGVAWRLMGEGGTSTSTSASAPSLPSTEGVQVSSAEQFMGAQPVAGIPVVRDTLWVHVVATGLAAANQRSVLAARSSGVVQRVAVRENDPVQAGDLLVQLDTTDAAMNLAQAEASLLQAEVAYQERMLYAGELLAPEAMAERERIVRVESGVAQAEVNLARAELELEQTRVRAPFSGRVADLGAVEGAYLSAGQEVLTLVQLDPIKVEVNVLEGALGLLASGRQASVRFTAGSGEVFTARIETLNPVVDPATSAGRVTLVLPNPAGRILPGMYAHVTLDAEAFPDRILVPREAVLERDVTRREMVFMFRPREEGSSEGIAEWRYVTTGRRNETHVEILETETTSLLHPGETILIDGHHYLAHDVPVRLVDDVRAAGGRPGG
jgi:membrane fusion protein, multidrug efflux system